MKDRKRRVCREDEPIEARKVLDMVLHDLHIDMDNPKAAIGMTWKDIIGARLFLHVKLVDIKGPILVLRADHPSWAQMTLMQQRRIVDTVRKNYPSLGIRSLQVLSA